MTCSFHLVDHLRNARSELLAACQDISEADLHRPPPSTGPGQAGGWAIIELLAHLPDVDRYYLSQARAIRDAPGHAFVSFDEEAWQRDNAGPPLAGDARAVRLAMAAAHEEVVRWTRSLTPEELDRAGGHPRRGSITVRELLQRIANHDRAHTEQVLAIRRALTMSP